MPKIDLSIVDHDSELKYRILPLTVILCIGWIIICACAGWYAGIPIGMIVAGIVINVMKTMEGYSIVGNAALSGEHILISLDKQEKLFPVVELGQLEFRFEAYAPVNQLTQITIHTAFGNHGANNLLKFRHNGKEHRHELLIRKEDLPGLNAIFDTWRKQGVPFDLVDILGSSLQKIS